MSRVDPLLLRRQIPEHQLASEYMTCDFCGNTVFRNNLDHALAPCTSCDGTMFRLSIFEVCCRLTSNAHQHHRKGGK